MRGVRGLCDAAFAVACLALPSCALVDQYADRATTYNLEAEQAQEKSILLNIIRASQRHPLQFTTVTSIAGSLSATGGGGYSAPVNIPFRSSGGTGGYPGLDTWTASGSLSGSETFTVPVLDTQEFYQGILKPIPSQYYDLLVQQRYPADLLFNLFIQKVVMRNTRKDCTNGDHTEKCEHTFTNYVSSDDDIVEFQMFAHFLIRAGLTTESADSRKDSLLKGAMNINLKLFGSTGQAGTSGQTAGGTSGSSQSGEPLPKNYVFCFAPKHEQYSISQNGGCGATGKNASIVLDDQSHTTTTVESLRGKSEPPNAPGIQLEAKIRALRECDPPVSNKRYEKFCSTMRKFATGDKISFAFYTKSTEAVIYYLGEVARRQLYPDQFGSEPPVPFSLLISTPGPDEDYDVDTCVQPPLYPASIHCQYLLRIDNSPLPSPVSIWTTYGGVGYAVSDYLHEGGYSMTSMGIVKQLVALFSSAKTLPSTTVLSVVNQ